MGHRCSPSRPGLVGKVLNAADCMSTDGIEEGLVITVRRCCRLISSKDILSQLLPPLPLHGKSLEVKAWQFVERLG